jgi:putative transcriptional regulator
MTPSDTLNLQDQLLIAMPGISDNRFEHAVSLIARHDNDGCFGLVLNNVTDTTLGDLFDYLKIEANHDDICSILVREGGPVQLGQGFVLHDGEKNWENTIRIKNNLAITASKDILTAIAMRKGPNNFEVMLGCASWSAGQIEEELLSNTWLTCQATHQLIFDIPPIDHWKNASALLGIDIRLIATTAGHA